MLKKGAELSEVAVRKDAAAPWKPTGRICVLPGVSPLGAAMRQKALIEEHGKRIHIALAVEVGKAPLQVGVRPAPEAEFEPLGKKSADVPEVSDEEIGFEGTPDPASGYYCSYKDGRIANFEYESAQQGGPGGGTGSTGAGRS